MTVRGRCYCGAHTHVSFVSDGDQGECCTEFFVEKDDPVCPTEWWPCPRCGSECDVEWLRHNRPWDRASLWLYGRANRHPYGRRRRRAWATLAVILDRSFPFLRPKLRALRGTRQPRWSMRNADARWYDSRRLQGSFLVCAWAFIVCWAIWGPWS